MLGLLAASVLAWAIWAGKLVQLTLAQRHLGRDYRALAARGNLGATPPKGMLARMQAAALAEIRASEGLPAAGVKERVAIELARIEAGAARALQSGVTAVGSIGSTAPFVGLFGTVWGIMNAFVGIAESGSSSLAVVAPGIAEALMATALGLIAAIPAMLLYNPSPGPWGATALASPMPRRWSSARSRAIWTGRGLPPGSRPCIWWPNDGGPAF